MTENDNPVCKRCAICCHYFDVQGVLKRCRYVVRLRGGKTLCRIYNRRLGTVIGRTMREGKILDIMCCKRDKVPYNYPGCPFNKVGQVMPFLDNKVPCMQYKLGMFNDTE